MVAGLPVLHSHLLGRNMLLGHTCSWDWFGFLTDNNLPFKFIVFKKMQKQIKVLKEGAWKPRVLYVLFVSIFKIPTSVTWNFNKKP